jgi:hypothetical protein
MGGRRIPGVAFWGMAWCWVADEIRLLVQS